MSIPKALSSIWDMGKADDHAGGTAKPHKKRRTFYQSSVTSLPLLSVKDAFFAHDVCEVTTSALSEDQPRSSLVPVRCDQRRPKSLSTGRSFGGLPVKNSSDIETRVDKEVIIFVICMLQVNLLQCRPVIMQYQLSYAILEELIDGDSNNRILGIELSVCDEFQVLIHKTRCVKLLVSEMDLWGLEREPITCDRWELVAACMLTNRAERKG